MKWFIQILKLTYLFTFTIAASLLFVENTGVAQKTDRGISTPGTSSPFNKRDDLFEDEDFFDEETDELSDEMIRSKMEQKLKERAGSAPSAPPTGRPPVVPPTRGGVDFGSASQSTGTTISTGANARITPGEQSKSCLKLDIDTGYGPDVISNFDFPDADIVEIAKTLGRLTCQNFILDKDVKGRISVVSNSAITVGDAWKAFLTALDVNGFSLIPSGKYLRIARQRDAKDKQIKTYSGDFSPDSDLFITRILPLKYINAEEVRRVFSTFMPPNTRMVAYDQTNTLIITDTGSNIKRITDMLKHLDIETYDEKLEVIPIKWASSQDIAKLIDQLLPGGRGGSGAPPGAPRFGSFAVRRTKEGGVISNIIPDDRTNAVIISANSKGLEQVRELIKKLDAKVTISQGGSKIHVIYLQYSDAKEITNTVSNLIQGSGPRQTGSILPSGASPGGQLFEGQIKISADEATNSLVITGTPADFQTVKSVIQKLDIPRDQVYVEAIIMEITVDKSFEVGTSVALPTSGVGFLPNDDLGKYLLNPFALSGLILGFQRGQQHTITLPGTNTSLSVSTIQGLIKAIQANTNSNVLATPQILTLDNKEASIEIGETLPVLTTTAVQGAGVSQSVSREKAALTLKIKPQINKVSNFVKLDIDQKLEDFAEKPLPEAVKNLAQATQSRSSKTTVVVQDGDTIALGGLVRDKVQESATKVPLLGDIPIIGWLFRSKKTITSKQNLLVFITPKIIKQYHQIRKVLDSKIRERDEFVERSSGGNDPHEHYKHKLIKSLPKVEDLKALEKAENVVQEEDDTVPETPITPESPDKALTK